MAPTVGRVVHYVSYGTPGGEYSSVCRAATITDTTWAADGVAELSDGTELQQPVGLAVLNPTGLFFHTHVGHDEVRHSPGTWHWPERVDEPTSVPLLG